MQTSSIAPPSFAVDDRPDSSVFAAAFSAEDDDSDDSVEVPVETPTRESIVKPSTATFPVVRHDSHRLETAQKQQPSQEKKAEKSTADYSAVSVGSQVLHAKFGMGKVRLIENEKITVDFSEGTKKFEFPAAIEKGFLKSEPQS